MGFYNVVAPCVVGKLHYARPTAQPIEVDDAEAAELVESGSLTPYQPGVPEADPVEPTDEDETDVGDTGIVIDDELDAVEPGEAPADPPAPRPRRRRTED